MMLGGRLWAVSSTLNIVEFALPVCSHIVFIGTLSCLRQENGFHLTGTVPSMHFKSAVGEYRGQTRQFFSPYGENSIPHSGLA